MLKATTNIARDNIIPACVEEGQIEFILPLSQLLDELDPEDFNGAELNYQKAAERGNQPCKNEKNKPPE